MLESKGKHDSSFSLSGTFLLVMQLFVLVIFYLLTFTLCLYTNMLVYNIHIIKPCIDIASHTAWINTWMFVSGSVFFIYFPLDTKSFLGFFRLFCPRDERILLELQDRKAEPVKCQGTDWRHKNIFSRFIPLSRSLGFIDFSDSTVNLDAPWRLWWQAKAGFRIYESPMEGITAQWSAFVFCWLLKNEKKHNWVSILQVFGQFTVTHGVQKVQASSKSMKEMPLSWMIWFTKQINPTFNVNMPMVAHGLRRSRESFHIFLF